MRVGSLNISATIKNPDEYYDGTRELKNRNDVFADIIATEIKKPENIAKYGDKSIFYDYLSSVDKETAEWRYTPFYNALVDLNKRDFLKKWNKVWNTNYNETVEKQLQKKWNMFYKRPQDTDIVTEEEAQSFKEYVEDVKKAYQIFDMSAIQMYKQVGFTNSGLQQMREQKIPSNTNKTVNIILYMKKNKVDVLFVQEGFPLDEDVLFIGGYKYVGRVDPESGERTGIILRNDLVGFEVSYESDFEVRGQKTKVEKGLFIYVIRGHYYISAHLTSKKRGDKKVVVNGEEIDSAINYQDQLIELNYYFEGLRQRGIGFTMGVDANHQINGENITTSGIHFTHAVSTTKKMRTEMQCQFKKINVLSEECKDAVLSTRRIRNERVLLVNGTDAIGNETSFLPSAEHPFDHYVVDATLI